MGSETDTHSALPERHCLQATKTLLTLTLTIALLLLRRPAAAAVRVEAARARGGALLLEVPAEEGRLSADEARGAALQPHASLPARTSLPRRAVLVLRAVLDECRLLENCELGRELGHAARREARSQSISPDRPE